MLFRPERILNWQQRHVAPPAHSSALLYFSQHWASLVAQVVKNPSAVQETQVQSLGPKVPWGREWLPTPVFFPGEYHGHRSLADYSLWGRKESDVTE